MKVILYTSLYPEKNEFRKNEILVSLKNNINNKNIDKIVILNEGFDDDIINNKKITNIPTSQRPTFAYFEQFLDENAINIITNNDIWFDNSLSKLKWFSLAKGDFLSLTRTEKDGQLFRETVGDSQDTWIFLGKPLPLKKCNFYLGKLGCDNKINYIFYKGGYRVLNPSKSIKTYHEHLSNHRTYTEAERITGEYLFAHPINFFQFQIARLVLRKLNSMRLNHIENLDDYK